VLPGATFTTVPVVVIKNSQHWDHEIPTFMQEIQHRDYLASSDNATNKLYWIRAIGPTRTYGEKEDGQLPKPSLTGMK
jgi:hypothetical protein